LKKKGNYYTKIESNTTIDLSKQSTLFGSPTLNLEAKNSKKTKIQVTSNKIQSQASRRLPIPRVSSKDSSIISKLEQILATSLRKERAIWEREGWERFGYSNYTLRIDVK
jgi:hypothetical protein